VEQVQAWIGKELREILENKNLTIIANYGFKIDDDGHELWSVVLYDKEKQISYRVRVVRYPGNRIVVINV